MPGEFFIEGQTEKTDLARVIETVMNESYGLEALKGLVEGLGATSNGIAGQTAKLGGLAPGTGSIVGDWETAENDLITLGAEGVAFKLHSLLVSIHALAGTAVTLRLYTKVNGVERKVYEQVFDAAADPAGLWIVNGTVAIHETLLVTLQSDDPADNGQWIDYDYLLEAM